MKRNPFNEEELNRWFIFNQECWYCKLFEKDKTKWNYPDCFHHIKGGSNSLLNAAPLNNFNCHLPNHGKLKKEENRKKLLKETFIYLLSQGYKISKKEDIEFIEENKEIYEKFLTPSKIPGLDNSV